MNELLAERIERLLVRHEESRRTVALLERQIHDLTAERDNLQLRLKAASLRIDTVLQHLPVIPAPELDETI